MPTIPQKVLDLVDIFDRNSDEYRSADFKEANLRIQFINPLFKVLGWDMDNEQGHAEAYKDVIHEASLKIGAETKAPDYCFRIGGTPKFYLEAKKPHVNIKDDPAPAFQLRRYGWSKKLSLSILTDFEEFAVYDCRYRPSQGDKASDARIMYLRYSDYAKKWPDIAEVFARDAILKGSFDKYAVSTRAKKGTATVDAAFLADIEEWRFELAKNLAHRNRQLGSREINYAVQMTIDRVIFLRMCEDRGIEKYGQLRDLISQKNMYAELCKLFDLADQRYNSGLFHFSAEPGREAPDTLTPKLTVDDKTLKPILKSLYYPDSPYEFSVIPPEILGQVYEQFLGKVIRLTTGHTAKIEEKPEVKKAGGVYYTPTYIVDYIVKHTVGKLLGDPNRTPHAPREEPVTRSVTSTIAPDEPLTPRQAAKLRILDPACGSGSFLLGAYDYLLQWHLARYLVDGPEKHKKELYQSASGAWKLTTKARRDILLNNIYGVDIDPQAVEVTKLSLLLKVLEGETQDALERQLLLFHERALPDLSSNIKCGNSLIGPDFYDGQQPGLFDDDEKYRINVFDWNAAFPAIMGGGGDSPGGFDAVIGNPPYDVLEKERGAASWPHEALVQYVRERPDYQHAMGGKLNLFRFFLVRSLHLVRIGGRFGMIMPLALMADASCNAPRRFLITNSIGVEADCFPQKDNAARRVFHSAKLSTGIVVCRRAKAHLGETAVLNVRTYPWNLFTDVCREYSVRFHELALIDPENIPIPLCDKSSWHLCKRLHESPSVTRMGDCGWIRITRGEINQTIYRDFIHERPGLARLLKGVEVGQYCQRETLKQGKREWFDERAFLKKNTERPVVRSKRIATQRITGVDERLRIVATVIDPPCYFADSTNSIFIEPISGHRLEYVLGLLNSTLFQWRFKLTSTNNNVGTNELACMPLRIIAFGQKDDVARHERMVSLVSQMLTLHQQLAAAMTPHEKTVLETQITATDRQIDRLVYDLYGLTEDEIKIVEEATA